MQRSKILGSALATATALGISLAQPAPSSAATGVALETALSAPATLTAGDTAQVAVTVRNTGLLPASNISVGVHAADHRVTVLSVTATNGSCFTTPDLAGCEQIGIGPGESVTVLAQIGGAHTGTATVMASLGGNDRPLTAVATRTMSISGNCTQVGTNAGEVITGTTGSDVLCGFGGNDTFLPGSGRDLVLGGAGSDTVSYANQPAVEVDLGSQTATMRHTDMATDNDSFRSVENAIGSNEGDILRGDSAKNSLSGLGGADIIFGSGGTDLLVGGDGDDYLGDSGSGNVWNGGNGTDTCLNAPAGVAAGRSVFSCELR